MVRGIIASPGFAIGEAFIYVKPELHFSIRSIADPRPETVRFLAASDSAIGELMMLKERTLAGLGEDLAHIFRSQQTMAEDESTRDEVCRHIETNLVCAEQALFTVFDSYRAMFAELADDDYNKARATDIEDVYKRILRILLGLPEMDLSALRPGTIVVGEELFPSDTAIFDASKVIGIITERGGVTSHVAILAKNLGIPAAVSVSNATGIAATGNRLVLDATAQETAYIHVNPDAGEIAVLERNKAAYEAHLAKIGTARGQIPITRDGHRITISVNIGSDKEALPAREKGATSVGLFRSEFLFIGKTKLPDEEEQFRAYRAAVETFPDGFVIVRTLDAGGDKQVPGLSIPQEGNPFLGYRALRICLDRPDIFIPQLRAVLRASHFGKMKIMFPMVSGVSEVRAALAILDDCRHKLRAEGHAFDESMEVGIMVEIPSAVLLARELAELVDFFSIGTNDLTQYLLAADRMNSKVQSYYRGLDPSVFRAVAMVVEAAHARQKWVGVCGELGGNPMAIPTLIGLGVDELSMSAQSLSQAVYEIRVADYALSCSLARKVLSLDSQEAIVGLLNARAQKKE